MMVELVCRKIALSDSLPNGELVSFLNPWSYLVMRSDPKILEGMDAIHFDGISLAVLFRLIWKSNITRRSFDMTSLAVPVFQSCVERGLRVALVGSTQENITNATDNILRRFPALNVVRINDGYFSTDEKLDSFCISLAKTNPDVIIVGMGAPRQERFLMKMRSFGWKGSGYTCGGFFHQTAKRLEYYPKLIDKLNIRWMYRIFDEPKLIRRYLVQYPSFFVLFVLDLFAYWFRKAGRALR